MNKKYEAIFIIKNTDKENIENIKNKIEMIVKQEYCDIYEKNELGLRKLAYEVKGEKEGYYYQIYFETKDDKINSIGSVEANIRTVEEILKYIIVRLDN